jgi:hypothetical protein
MTISKALFGAAVALVIAMPATAQAQCSYRVNDVGLRTAIFPVRATALRKATPGHT